MIQKKNIGCNCNENNLSVYTTYAYAVYSMLSIYFFQTNWTRSITTRIYTCTRVNVNYILKWVYIIEVIKIITVIITTQHVMRVSIFSQLQTAYVRNFDVLFISKHSFPKPWISILTLKFWLKTGRMHFLNVWHLYFYLTVYLDRFNLNLESIATGKRLKK